MTSRLRCEDCNMVFGSPVLLQKHRSKFCVGTTAEVDILTRRSHLTDPRRSPSPVDDVPRYNPNQDAQARQLAETHGRQMEFLNSRNRDLERQREDIRRRLEELGRRPAVIIQKENAPPPPPPPPAKPDISTELLLQQLKDQESRNQKTLDELKRELFYLRDKKEVAPVIQQAPPPPPPPQIIEIERPAPAPSKPTKNYIYPVYYGGSLVAEISAMRQAYLQNRGNDPEVLNNLALMLEEAKALEDAQRDTKRERVKEKKVDVVQGTQIQSMEFENERLQRELFQLQEQNVLNKKNVRDGREDEFDRDLKRLQQDYIHRMNELQYEMELLRQQAALDRMRPRDPPPPPPPQQTPAPPVRQYVEVDPLAPYDPNRRKPAGPLKFPSDEHTWVNKQHKREDYYDIDHSSQLWKKKNTNRP